MVVRSIKNQYPGINAHLHSYWQAQGGWSGFHTSHISDLHRAMLPLLLPMGYSAELEPSLQIRRMDEFGDSIHNPESDVTIYDLNPVRRFQPASQGAAPGEMVLAIPEALYGEPESEKEYSAIKIYDYLPGRLARGEPVAWIELLSPSNKPGGRDAREYFNKRLMIIESGIVFVEIDYLHEYAPTFRGIPNYKARKGIPADENAHPYQIVVIDPHPDVETGIVRVKGFDVDAPIPTVEIPLHEGEKLSFNFGIAYQKTFEETLVGFKWVDYAELPLNFDRYSYADQTRITRRMLAVMEAAQHGVDLEASAPLPVKEITLEDALLQIGQIKQTK